tara:strand:+ start:22076 stop:23437 length:1362 start_codon:yes stop_codon:yes gene_type:complete
LSISNIRDWKNVAVIGLGATGFSCIRYFNRLGRQVTVFDSREDPPFANRLREEKIDSITRFGEFNAKELKSADILVVSPGVSLEEPAIVEARSAGIEIISDIELFSRSSNRPIIGITGSNGKSTVTKLTETLLKAAGVSVSMGGNIGPPALDLLGYPEPDYYLLELSSFQLEATSTLRPLTFAILNISPDHMDRYHDIDAYIEAKTRISALAGTIIVNRDDVRLSRLFESKTMNPSLITFGLTEPLSEKDFGLTKNHHEKYLSRGSERLIKIDDLKMEGLHNIGNALAALAIIQTVIPVKMDEILDALRKFSGLPHRCEVISNYRGVRWINDSKGTNVGATVAALEGMGRPVVLIVGGQAKNADFNPLAQSAQRYARQVVLFGEDSDLISSYLSDAVPVTKVTTLAEATSLAAEWAQPGDAVLFSPACASFDMFDNFEHRGDSFRALVSGITQ